MVTGAARGIGRAIALRLADRGYDVVVVGRDLSETYERYGEVLDAPTVQDEVELRGRQVVACEEDLRDAGAAGRVVAAATVALGRVDVLVNNAGGALTPVERSLASEMTVDDPDAMMLLNLRSAVALCQAVVPVMRGQGGGSIVNIGSRVAVDPSIANGRLAPYALSKTSLVQYTRLLAHEVGPDAIRVTEHGGRARDRHRGGPADHSDATARRTGRRRRCGGLLRLGGLGLRDRAGALR